MTARRPLIALFGTRSAATTAPTPRPCLIRSLAAALAVAALSACQAVGPSYTPPAFDGPGAWQAASDGSWRAEPVDPQTLARWWQVFGDPVLAALEERAAARNLDLQEAAARLKEARALRGVAGAGLFPTLDATGRAATRRTSESSERAVGTETEFYQAGFDAGWELDVFGGTRRAVEAAQADLDAAQALLHEVRVSLAAEVALNYVEARTFQARLAVTLANIRSQQETYELNRSRYQAGLIDELAVQQSLYNLQHTRSQVAVLETGLEAAKNRLAVLLGETPGSLEPLLSENRPVPAPPPEVAVGVPAETLRNRPDIRRAERELAAATARIGQAAADLYPKFQLLGTIGLESLTAGDLLEWTSRFWTLGPGVTWRIFDAGAIRQNIRVRTARQEQAFVRYQAAVLRALEEVENALVAFAKEQRRREFLQGAVEAAQKAEFLARDRYRAGLVDFTDVLDAQRALQSFQDELAQSEGAVASNLVRLYKALGGGWQIQTANEGESTACNKSDVP